MIQATCLGCGQKLKVKDQLAGKKIKCPGCGDPMRIPVAAETVQDIPPLPLPAPPPSPPPPTRREPRAAVPVAAPPAPPPVAQQGFDFGQLPAEKAAEPGAFGGLAEAMDAPPTRRRRRSSPVKNWATHGALAGALTGVLLVIFLPPPEAAIIEALHKGMPKLEPDRIRGAVVGLVGGLLVGMAVLGVVGRSIESFGAVLVLLIAGAVYGGYRQADALEMAWPLLLAGTLGGVLVGALLGLLVGGIIAAARGRT
jgi:hypothetical protein